METALRLTCFPPSLGRLEGKVNGKPGRCYDISIAIVPMSTLVLTDRWSRNQSSLWPFSTALCLCL